MKKIQGALQKFGGAMYTPVLFTAFAGMMAGLSIVFCNEAIVGSIASKDSLWYSIWFMVGEGAWTVFRQLPVIFAAGLPIGLAKKQPARAALVSLLSYLTFNYYIQSIFKLKEMDLEAVGGVTGLTKVAGITTFDMSILGAIIIALIVVYISDKYIDKKLPEYLGTFSGAVFVYIVSFFVMIPLAILTYYLWPLVQNGILMGQTLIINLGAWGVWVYTFLERALIPTGLHHLVYQPFEYGPIVVEGGSKAAWIASIDTLSNTQGNLAQLFPAGGYMLFGNAKVFGSLGMAAAFYATAKKEKKKRTLGLLIPITLTAMLVGVTEPFEFSFLFVAPILFFVHAMLAAFMATIMFIVGLSGDFGAGIINFITLNYLPLWGEHGNIYLIQWLIGLVFSGVYFVVFRYLILKFDFKTPGREDTEDVKFHTKNEYKAKQNTNSDDKVMNILDCVGGVDNIVDVSNCATRLRLNVKDETKVKSDAEFRMSGAHGLVNNGKSLQIIIGLDVPQFREEFELEIEKQKGENETK